MEEHGLLIDQYMLTQVEQETVVKVQKLESELYPALGEINLASNPQVVEALQAKGIMGTRKTKAGKDSVSEESLKPLHNPIADKVLKWRSLMKTLTTYLPAFRSVDHTGRIHTSYGYTSTGRWNSSEPNLQNITRDEKFSDE
jgi:DNA polymerase I-like protein with 3'-5' exonuclease and polymerase domains